MLPLDMTIDSHWSMENHKAQITPVRILPTMHCVMMCPEIFQVFGTVIAINTGMFSVLLVSHFYVKKHFRFVSSLKGTFHHLALKFFDVSG